MIEEIKRIAEVYKNTDYATLQEELFYWWNLVQAEEKKEVNNG